MLCTIGYNDIHVITVRMYLRWFFRNILQCTFCSKTFMYVTHLRGTSTKHKFFADESMIISTVFVCCGYTSVITICFLLYIVLYVNTKEISTVQSVSVHNYHYNASGQRSFELICGEVKDLDKVHGIHYRSHRV